MKSLERGLESARKSPLRYVPVWGMTAARPVLGWQGMRAAKEGDWKKARSKFRKSSLSDLEGYVARPLRATSKSGAIADPIADGIERAEVVIALAPKMSKVATGAMLLFEADTLRLNAKIQKGRKDPIVPKGAKWGSAVEAAGADVFMTGMVDDSRLLRVAGQTAIVYGAAIRNLSYRAEYIKLQHEEFGPHD